MGYTHYWERPTTLSRRKFRAAACDCRRVVQSLGLSIRYDSDTEMPAVFDNDQLHFNGIAEHGHEPFQIERVYTPPYQEKKPSMSGLWWSFCKTARNPYDAAVCVCLIILRHYFGEKFIVTSDGDDEEEGWPVARLACQQVLGYGADFSLLTAGFERLPRRGLPFKGEAGQSLRKCYRLSNGWLMFQVGAMVKVFKPDSDAYCDNDPVVTAGNLTTARWLATLAHIEGTLLQNARSGKPAFQMEPFFADARGTLHNWTPLAVLADALEDKDDGRCRVLRAILPKEVASTN